MSKLQATAFWNDFHSIYPHDRVYSWMDAVASGEADWFRELGLTAIAIAEHCRIGRFGFDQKKYDKGQAQVHKLLKKHQLDGLMQW